MAHTKIIRLSKREAKFIKWATILPDGVLDFENNSSSEFRKIYGISKDDVGKIVQVLQAKMDNLLTQYDKEKK